MTASGGQVNTELTNIATSINTLYTNLGALATTANSYAAWTTWTPTLTASAGTWGTITSSSYRYTIVGKKVTVEFFAYGTLSGTPTNIRFTLPVTPALTTDDFISGGGMCYQNGTSTSGYFRYDNATATIHCRRYDNNPYPATTGNGFGCNFSYEIA